MCETRRAVEDRIEGALRDEATREKPPRQGWEEAGTRRPDASLVFPVARMDPPSPHEISPLGESYGNLIFIVNVFVSLSPRIIEFHMLQVHLSQPA